MFRSLPFITTAAALSLFSIGATPLRTAPSIPDGGPPRVQMAGISSGEVSRKALLAKPVIDLHGCVPTARVVAFTLRLDDGTGAATDFRTKESKLSERMIEALRKAPVGSVITITALDVVDGDGKAWEVPEAKFTLAA